MTAGDVVMVNGLLFQGTAAERHRHGGHVRSARTGSLPPALPPPLPPPPSLPPSLLSTGSISSSSPLHPYSNLHLTSIFALPPPPPSSSPLSL
eukprot:751030-Hanusia_phi.AAC.1